MIYLDSDTDSILPYGLKGTPFETVFKALQAVASTVWPVDAAELRAAIGWGWYLDNNLEELILLSAGKQYIQNILISEQVPLIKSTQTQEELVDLLYRWKSYKPTFDKLEELYIPYAARVDIRPITDEATQEILPVTDIHNAFYVVLTDIDWSRPLTLGEAALIAERATPMGSHPIAVFQFEETTNVYPQLAYGDVNFYTGTFEPAAEPIPPVPPPPEPAYSFIVVDATTGEVVHSIVDEGLVYGDVGYVLMDETGNMITVYETGVRTESFYFTTNGRNETENTNISHADIPVYNEDGTAPAADTPYNGSAVMAFMDVDGNTKQADGESLYLDDGVLRLDAPDTDEGEQWSALVEYIEPAPPLPTVERTYGWATTGSSGGSAESCNARSYKSIYDSNQDAIVYDSTKSYVIQIGNGSGTTWRIEFFCAQDSSGFLVAWNRTNVALNVLGVALYSCSSSSAYRVIVANSSDVKYPAFAYDYDGTTYYYVLDNTQTDWTSDLSSIGYSLVNGNEAYLTSLGSSETVNTILSNSSYYLYSSSGSYLYGDQSKKYVLINQFLINGANVTNDGMDPRLTSGTGMSCSAVGVSSYVSSWNRLTLNGNLYGYNVFRITYLEV